MQDRTIQPKLRVRPLSPLGWCPESTISIQGARLVPGDDLAYVLTEIRTEDGRGHNLFGGYTELEFLALEETRFLAAIMLSLHPDKGQIDLYPLPRHIDFPLGSIPHDIDAAARRFAQSPDASRHHGVGAPCYRPLWVDRLMIAATGQSIRRC
jgi:hypothetical protein